MMVLPGLVLIINPSLPMLCNSSFVMIDEMRAEDEAVQAINVLDLSGDDNIL